MAKDINAENAIGRKLSEVLSLPSPYLEKLYSHLADAQNLLPFEYKIEGIARSFFIRPVFIDKQKIIILYLNPKGEIVNANKEANLEYGYTKSSQKD